MNNGSDEPKSGHFRAERPAPTLGIIGSRRPVVSRGSNPPSSRPRTASGAASGAAATNLYVNVPLDTFKSTAPEFLPACSGRNGEAVTTGELSRAELDLARARQEFELKRDQEMHDETLARLRQQREDQSATMRLDRQDRSLLLRALLVLVLMLVALLGYGVILGRDLLSLAPLGTLIVALLGFAYRLMRPPKPK
jgi:hypothetical protein